MTAVRTMLTLLVTTVLGLALSVAPASAQLVGPDVQVVKSDSQDPVLVGGSFAYTILVTNNGPGTAQGVILVDALVDVLALDPVADVTTTQGSCGVLALVVTCDLGSLADGATATVTIDVTVDNDPLLQILDTAVVTALLDADLTNNVDTESTTVTGGVGVLPTADLQLTKTASPNPVGVGEPLTYTLTVHNNGPDTATGVVLIDALADILALDPVSDVTPSQGSCTVLSGLVTCALGTLASGSNAMVVIEVRPSLSGLRVNAAAVVSTSLDLTLSNNATNVTTIVNPTCTVLGTPGDDVLTGTPGDDVICGLGGNDRLAGLGGNDLLIGGDGNDVLNGGPGNDRLRGNAGSDILNGGLGSDSLNGGLDNDRLRGYAGSDILYGARGSDSLNGGLGNDRLRGNAGNDILYGARGNDRLSGGVGRDTLNGGRRSDILNGGPGNDRLRGHAGNDILNGARGNDILNGGLGNDRLRGYVGNDILYGGYGRDRLIGGFGRDRLLGGRGNDFLNGGPGRDRLNGGPGTDRCIRRGQDIVRNCELS